MPSRLVCVTFHPGFSVAVDLRRGDAEFIAAARTLVPELVAEVEKLRTELAFARDGMEIRPMTEVESNLMTQVLYLRRRLAKAEAH